MTLVQLKELIESDKLGRLIAFQGIWTLRKPASYFDDVPWRKMPGSGGVILTNLSELVVRLSLPFQLKVFQSTRLIC